MGEREHYQPADWNQPTNREAAYLARGSEVAKVTDDVHSTQAKEHVLMRQVGSEIFVRTPVTLPQRFQDMPQWGEVFVPYGVYFSLGQQYEQLSQKTEQLKEENTKLWEENDRLREENKALTKQLTDKLELQRKHARESYHRQRQRNPEEYRKKRAEYMREYRKRKQQEASESED